MCLGNWSWQSAKSLREKPLLFFGLAVQPVVHSRHRGMAGAHAWTRIPRGIIYFCIYTSSIFSTSVKLNWQQMHKLNSWRQYIAFPQYTIFNKSIDSYGNHIPKLIDTFQMQWKRGWSNDFLPLDSQTSTDKSPFGNLVIFEQISFHFTGRIFFFYGQRVWENCGFTKYVLTRNKAIHSTKWYSQGVSGFIRHTTHSSNSKTGRESRSRDFSSYLPDHWSFGLMFSGLSNGFSWSQLPLVTKALNCSYQPKQWHFDELWK